MRNRQRLNKPAAAEVFTASVIIERLAANGARLRISDSGQLYVGQPSKIPAALWQIFLDFPRPAELVAAARQHLISHGHRQRITPIGASER